MHHHYGCQQEHEREDGEGCDHPRGVWEDVLRVLLQRRRVRGGAGEQRSGEWHDVQVQHNDVHSDARRQRQGGEQVQDPADGRG